MLDEEHKSLREEKEAPAFVLEMSKELGVPAMAPWSAADNRRRQVPESPTDAGSPGYRVLPEVPTGADSGIFPVLPEVPKSSLSLLERLLPTDALLNVVLFLSVSEISALARSSRSCLSLCGSGVLWERLIRRDFDVEGSPHVNLLAEFKEGDQLPERLRLSGQYFRNRDFREMYKANYSRSLRTRSQRIKRFGNRILEMQRRKRQQSVWKWFKISQRLLLPEAIIALVFISCLILSLRLEAGQFSQPIRWYLPLIFALVIFFTSFAACAFIQFGPRISALREVKLAQSDSPIPLLADAIFNRRSRIDQLCIYGIMLSLLVLFPTLLLVNLSIFMPWNYSLVFLPVWISFFISMIRINSIFGDLSTGLEIFFIFIAPVFATSIVLVVFIENENPFPFQNVMIPLWIIQAAILIVAIVQLLIAILKRFPRPQLIRSSIVFAAISAFMLPLIIFEVLLAGKINHVRKIQAFEVLSSWPLVFVPLFIWFLANSILLLGISRNIASAQDEQCLFFYN